MQRDTMSHTVIHFNDNNSEDNSEDNLNKRLMEMVSINNKALRDTNKFGEEEVIYELPKNLLGLNIQEPVNIIDTIGANDRNDSNSNFDWIINNIHFLTHLVHVTTHDHKLDTQTEREFVKKMLSKVSELKEQGQNMKLVFLLNKMDNPDNEEEKENFKVFENNIKELINEVDKDLKYYCIPFSAKYVQLYNQLRNNKDISSFEKDNALALCEHILGKPGKTEYLKYLNQKNKKLQNKQGQGLIKKLLENLDDTWEDDYGLNKLKQLLEDKNPSIEILESQFKRHSYEEKWDYDDFKKAIKLYKRYNEFLNDRENILEEIIISKLNDLDNPEWNNEDDISNYESILKELRGFNIDPDYKESFILSKERNTITGDIDNYRKFCNLSKEKVNKVTIKNEISKEMKNKRLNYYEYDSDERSFNNYFGKSQIDRYNYDNICRLLRELFYNKPYYYDIVNYEKSLSRICGYMIYCIVYNKKIYSSFYENFDLFFKNLFEEYEDVDFFTNKILLILSNNNSDTEYIKFITERILKLKKKFLDDTDTIDSNQITIEEWLDENPEYKKYMRIYGKWKHPIQHDVYNNWYEEYKYIDFNDDKILEFEKYYIKTCKKSGLGLKLDYNIISEEEEFDKFNEKYDEKYNEDTISTLESCFDDSDDDSDDEKEEYNISENIEKLIEDIHYTSHSSVRMKEYNISKNKIINCLKKGKITETRSDCKRAVLNNLHVIFDIRLDDKLAIITTYYRNRNQEYIIIDEYEEKINEINVPCCTNSRKLNIWDNNEITRSDTIDHIFNDKLNPPLNVYSDDNSDNIDDASSCFSFTDDEHDAYILNNK